MDAHDGGRFFSEDTSKMPEFVQNFIFHKCNSLRLNESHRLVTTVLVLSSQIHQIQNISLKTIAASLKT